jgi:5-formyltetrahydrofolate cyclo-ligase
MSDIPASSSKDDLRIAALAKRDALGSDDRAAAAQLIALRGLPSQTMRGTVVAGYFPIRTEVDPTPLMRNLAARGAELALPVIVSRDRALKFRSWSVNQKLVRGPLGIFESAPEAAEITPDIVLVPLAAFDRAGHRIGYGAGHYDRTLAHLRGIKQITAIGVAFATQEIAAIAAQPHDAALDYVLTEVEMIDFRRS